MAFFFTELDDRIRPKGSRDPLGLEHVWSLVGRRLIGNLTTVTNNLDNFILAILGFELSSDAEGKPQWEIFEKYEQIIARTRYLMPGEYAKGILGSRKISSTQNFDPIPLGSKKDASILSYAQQSGLWGIYASALAATGLSKSDRVLTDEGRQFAKEFLETLPKSSLRWLKEVLEKSSVSRKELNTFAAALKQTLYSTLPRLKLKKVLLNGSLEMRPQNIQEELHKQAIEYQKQHNTDNLFTFFDYVVHNSQELGGFSQKVMKLEAVLIIARRVFDYLLGRHGATREELAVELKSLDNWPKRSELEIPDFMEISNAAWKKRVSGLKAFVEPVRQGDWLAAADNLIAHHAAVMKTRSGPSWVFFDNNAIKVIFRGQETELPTQQQMVTEVSEYWDNSYFVDSFLAVLRQTSTGRAEI